MSGRHDARANASELVARGCCPVSLDFLCSVESFHANAQVRRQADGRLPVAQRRNYRNVVHGLYRVALDEGISAWYRGVGPLVTRGVLVTTAQVSWGGLRRANKSLSSL